MERLRRVRALLLALRVPRRVVEPAAARRLRVADEVRRPPLRLLEFEPIPEVWLRDVLRRFRLADFMRLVAIVPTLSAIESVSSLRILRDVNPATRGRLSSCDDGRGDKT